MSLPDLPRVDAYLSHHAATRPKVDAWIDGTRAISFAEADRWVTRLSKALLASGVEAGQRIGVCGRPSPEFLALFVAISSVGAIYVGLNPKYTGEELAVIVTDCEPVLLFDLLDGDSGPGGKLSALAARVASVREVIGASSLDAFAARGQTISNEKLAGVRAAIQPQDVALLVYTSGTTGVPKGAQLTHRGITFIAPITNDPSHFGVEGQGRTLCNLPINHVGCVVDLCTNNVIVGGTIVFQPDFDPEAMLKAIEEHRLTMIGGIPVMFLMMTRCPLFHTVDYGSLQKIIVAGNPPPLPLAEELQRVTRKPVMNGYGLTEAMGFSTFTAAGDSAETIANTVGRFDRRIEWRLADEAGRPVAEGDVGEIQMRGDWLFTGYFRRAEATAEAFAPGGWFRTGDLASITPDGNIKLAGRSKEMFKSGGYNVFPLEVEQALETLENVLMAIVVPVPDALFHEVGHAFVVASRRGLEASEVKEQLRSRLANYKIPKHVEFVDELPMLQVGKVDRIALKRRAEAAIDGRTT